MKDLAIYCIHCPGGWSTSVIFHLWDIIISCLLLCRDYMSGPLFVIRIFNGIRGEELHPPVKKFLTSTNVYWSWLLKLKRCLLFIPELQYQNGTVQIRKTGRYGVLQEIEIISGSLTRKSMDDADYMWSIKCPWIYA